MVQITLRAATHLAAALLLVGCGLESSAPTPAPTSKATPVAEGAVVMPTEDLPTATLEPTLAPVPPTATRAPAVPTATPTPLPTATPTQAPAPPLTLSSNPDNDLLFYATAEDGSRAYYYGLGEGEALDLTHVVLETADGDWDIIIFSEDLLPVQWIARELTVAVYPLDENGERADMNPHKAFHVAIHGEEEVSVVVDTYPGDLGTVVDEMEAATGQEFPEARAFLASYGPGFDEILGLARQPGPDQARFIAAATGFSAATASLRLAAAGAEVSAGRIPGLAAPSRQTPFGALIRLGAGALGEVIGREFDYGLDPGDGPSIEVLLCRGAAKYSLCHFMFFHRDRVGDCVTHCLTSLRCFTSICMPHDMSAESALKLRNSFFE